jgi:hypothetical protein
MSSESTLLSSRHDGVRTHLRCMIRLSVAATAVLVGIGCSSAPETAPPDLSGATTPPATTTPLLPVDAPLDASIGTKAGAAIDVEMHAASPGGADVGESVLAAFGALTRRRVACFTTPATCNVADFTAPNSPESRRIATAVSRFIRDAIRLSPRRGALDVTVSGIVRDLDTGMVVVEACERDSHVLVDARFTDLGEIIIDDSTVTTRARWHLSRIAAAWRIHMVEVLDRDHGGAPCSAS